MAIRGRENGKLAGALNYRAIGKAVVYRRRHVILNDDVVTVWPTYRTGRRRSHRRPYGVVRPVAILVRDIRRNLIGHGRVFTRSIVTIQVARTGREGEGYLVCRFVHVVRCRAD